jgi:hypothetical protein
MCDAKRTKCERALGVLEMQRRGIIREILSFCGTPPCSFKKRNVANLFSMEPKINRKIEKKRKMLKLMK